MHYTQKYTPATEPKTLLTLQIPANMFVIGVRKKIDNTKFLDAQ